MRLVTPVQFDVPVEFIVISYFPGSFGSILYHSLNSAPELGGSRERDIFVACGGAHKVTDEVFDRIKSDPCGVFHDGEEVDPWIVADELTQRQYLMDNINYGKIQQLRELNPERKYIMHRWVVPNAEHLVAKYLNCKIIGVIIDDKFDLDLTVKMHVNKSLVINQDWNILPKFSKNNPILAQAFPKLSKEQQLGYLTRVSQDRMAKINGPRSYDVGIRLKHFLTKESYLTRIKEISRFLNIHPDYDHVERIYIDFHRLNNIESIYHDQSI